MTDTPGPDPGKEAVKASTDDAAPHGEQQQGVGGEVLYRPLQVWSRPHPSEGVVSVHFATREHPERRFTLTVGAARELAIQLMRHSKRVRRAMSEREGNEPGGDP